MARSRYINKMFLLILFTMLTYGANAHAQINHKSNDSKLTWVMDAEPTPNQFRVESSRARVIVFRLTKNNDDLMAKPLNIFFNGQYHASLMPEHQSIALPVCPGKKKLSVSIDALPNGKNPQSAIVEDVTPALQAGEIYFYQVATDSNGKVFARWVNVDMAREVLNNVNIQAHTISRVAKDEACPTEIYSINSSALFKFARHDVQGMVKGATESLAELSEQIIKSYMSIDKIIVKGYADPVGSDAENKYLSEKRAATVANQLRASGLSDDVISSQGMGESNLLVTDCDKYSNVADITSCNQPNRRVEIEVYGVAMNSTATLDTH
ncbi:OmpA family protein [Enterobacteriaceae bacterium H20N1]|uniref:OmpA family protein n=1 Tax=Dryocola boscaweniae TaxID=2925397 RepID=A0A9X2WAZ1_9ENTR|nr:OmpA family protein [Dryocola boscaweniae]MCT4703348.1 OmpA family protein [Dryocola boscaweniae]MCT4720516.1 OmpA family protein [Dryocola boscaweniae]